MSGDCGHGWMYHFDGPSGPCYKCVMEDNARLRAEVVELRAGRTANMPTFVRRALAIAQVAEQHAAGGSLKGIYAQEIINEADELAREEEKK